MDNGQTELLVELRIEVELQAGDMDGEEAEAVIRQVCAAIAAKEELPDAEVSVSLVDNAEIQELNRQYRGIDRATDVLSFAMEEESTFAEAGEPLILGDIVISWPKVLEQAQAYGHSQKRELAFLTAHGFYHLLGYDHETAEDEEEMFGLQEAVLSFLGISR